MERTRSLPMKDIAELRCELPAVSDLPEPEDFQALVSEFCQALPISTTIRFFRFWSKDSREGSGYGSEGRGSQTRVNRCGTP